MPKVDDIIKIINKIIQLEEFVSGEIEKEKDAKKRKALLKAFKNRDSASLRKLWFK